LVEERADGNTYIQTVLLTETYLGPFVRKFTGGEGEKIAEVMKRLREAVRARSCFSMV
jgi:hypothetical protein